MTAARDRSRDVFPVRFKNKATREALRHVAEQTGQSMTDVVERAIEHEVVLLSADIEVRLQEALDVTRAYVAERDAEVYIDAAAAGERSGLDPFRRMRVSGEDATAVASDPYGVLAAFSRG